MTFGERFGQLIRRYRDAQGLSATELAVAIWKDEARKSHISAIENGKVKNPQAKTIDALVGHLAIPLEEVDACRIQQEPHTPPLPTDTGLSNELLENLAQRFGIENPDQRPDQLVAFLKETAKDYKARQTRLAELAAEDERMANTILAAKAALEAGDFDEADARLADAEEIQQESRTLAEVGKQANLRTERGNTALLNGKTEQAFAHFKKAAAYFEAFDADKACKLRIRLEDQLYSHGLRYGSDGMVWSASLLKLNFHHWTRESAPEHWANTQNSLAITLSNQGTRTGGEEGTKLLSDAITAYKNALKIYTRSEHPVDWAMTQNNLALALQNQGARTGGEEGTKLLNDAVTAYKNALKIRTQSEHPMDWVMTQNNLGGALQRQGERTGGEEGTKLLNDAVTAYKNALKIYTQSEHPVDWAITQNNLAIALEEQGKRTGGEEGKNLLKDAVTAYKNALKIRTQSDHPVQWAMTQFNMAHLYEALAEHQPVRSKEHLEEALACVDRALEVFDPDNMPYDFEKATELRARILDSLEALG